MFTRSHSGKILLYVVANFRNLGTCRKLLFYKSYITPKKFRNVLGTGTLKTSVSLDFAGFFTFLNILIPKTFLGIAPVLGTL